jgi:hypothetical protein
MARLQIYNNTSGPITVTIFRENEFAGGRVERGGIFDTGFYGAKMKIESGTNVWRYRPPVNYPSGMDRYWKTRGFNSFALRIQVEADGTLYVLTQKMRFPVTAVGPDTEMILVKPE